MGDEHAPASHISCSTGSCAVGGDFVGLGRPAFDNVATKSGLWDSFELLSFTEEFTELGRQAQRSQSVERTMRLKSEMIETLGKMIQRTSRIQRYSVENAGLIGKKGIEEYPEILQSISRRVRKGKTTARMLMRFGLREEHLKFIAEQFSGSAVDYMTEIKGNPFQALEEFSSSLGIMVEIIPLEDLRKSNPVDWHVVSVSLGITTAGLVMVFLAGPLDTSLSETMQTLGAGLVASGTTVLGTELATHKR